MTPTAAARTSLNTPAAEMFAAAGVIDNAQEIPRHLQLYTQQADQALDRVRGMVKTGEMSRDKGDAFARLLVDAGSHLKRRARDYAFPEDLA